MINPAQLAHGPMFIGLVFNVLLYGIMITQLYIYVSTYRKDPLWIKLYVACLFLADTFNTVFLMIYLYDSLILHFGDVPFLNTANWIFATGEWWTAFIGSMVQAFFAWRIRVLNMSWMFWVPASVCALIGAAGGLSTSIAIHFVSHFSDFQKFEIAVIFWLVAAATGDVFITVALTKYLRTHYTGYRATDDRIDAIMRLVVQTGMVTAVWAIIDLGVYLGDPTGTYVAFRLCFNSLCTPLCYIYTETTEQTPYLQPAALQAVQQLAAQQLECARRMEAAGIDCIHWRGRPDVAADAWWHGNAGSPRRFDEGFSGRVRPTTQEESPSRERELRFVK
ncbi:hypothetical protein BD626DRAFT_495889 [Schizophyllum amplum]|uniref:DUF6534 domain-containing protein n=1 Tax=Schizophyllum amplum TaxID=97359 RepID=A0A550CEJ7_9AGAR|nr:hypothetical protein BD626DRAFT_495889 [Auriculariopsis ampla]